MIGPTPGLYRECQGPAHPFPAPEVRYWLQRSTSLGGSWTTLAGGQFTAAEQSSPLGTVVWFVEQG